MRFQNKMSTKKVITSGKRKTAVARAVLTEGSGKIILTASNTERNPRPAQA